MSALMTECNVPEDFVKFLIKFNICTFDCFVWGARNSSDKVDGDLIDAANIKDITLTDKIAIRKAWWIAATNVEKQTAAKKAPAVAESNQDIDKEDSKSLHDLTGAIISSWVRPAYCLASCKADSSGSSALSQKPSNLFWRRSLSSSTVWQRQWGPS